MLDQCRTLLDRVIYAHLSDKSSHRVAFIFDHVGRPDFLDALFRRHSVHKPHLDSISDDLGRVIEGGDLWAFTAIHAYILI